MTTGILCIVFVVLTMALALHFLPAIIASCRHHPHAGAIFLLNLFLGWTVIGWGAALIWACIIPRPIVIYVREETRPANTITEKTYRVGL